eukprot:scaffold34042_cov53-Attheya_sp.AAC.4
MFPYRYCWMYHRIVSALPVCHVVIADAKYWALWHAIGQRHSKCGHRSGIGWDGTAAIYRLVSKSGGGAASGLG